jgi:hypothetical protein
MKNLPEIVNRNSVYLIFCLGFALLLSLYCTLLNKSEGFLLINQFHSRPLDIFFIVYESGKWLFAIGLMLRSGKDRLVNSNSLEFSGFRSCCSTFQTLDS